jgi:hypothetical protein
MAMSARAKAPDSEAMTKIDAAKAQRTQQTRFISTPPQTIDAKPFTQQVAI